jgi:hypothetical protein
MSGVARKAKSVSLMFYQWLKDSGPTGSDNAPRVQNIQSVRG